MKKRYWIGAACLAVAWGLPVAAAAEDAAASADDAFKFFLQEAEVVTASRRAQKKSDSPVAIDVISRDEIAKSGALNIWDLLRVRVGLDVSESNSIEGQAVQLNVRGLPSEFSQSLQVLIDGRSVVSGTNSGIFWRNLPVALADIDRIEIVRGPNSALFGANAGQGVINIITLKPSGGFKGAFKARAGQYGHLDQGLSVELGNERAAYRLSYEGRRLGSSPQPNGDTSKDLNGTALDERVNARGSLHPWEDGELELFAGASQRRFNISNPYSTLNTSGPNADSGSNDEGYAMLQLRQRMDEQSVELNASHRSANNGYAGASVRESVDDADLLGHLSLLDGKSQSTLGGSLRLIRSESSFLFNFNGNGDGSDMEENRLGRLYASESLGLADWISVSLAGSMESSDVGGQWPAYQGAVILKPWDGHSLRLSGSKSPSMPSLQASRADVLIPVAAPSTLPGPPLSPYAGTFPVGIVADGVGKGTAQVASYEATWSSSFLDRQLTAEITGFQMEIDGLIELSDGALDAKYSAGNFAPLGAGRYALAAGGYVIYDNAVSLVLRGTETVLTYKPVKGTSVQVNHTYEDVQYQNPNNPTDPFVKDVTPWNKVNLIVATELPWGLNVSGQLGWVGRHKSYLASRSISGWIEDQGKLDLRLGWKPRPEIEFFATGLNLDHAYRTEGWDGTAQAQQYYGGVNVSWGGK